MIERRQGKSVLPNLLKEIGWDKGDPEGDKTVVHIIVNELDGVKWEDLLKIKPIIKSGEVFIMTDVAPETAPILEAAEAVSATIANPSIPMLAEDLLLVYKLVGEVKNKLAGTHPDTLSLFNLLFNLGR